jgi:IS5 family transposase
MSLTEDLFCNRLDQLIDRRHPLAVLANHMTWQDEVDPKVRTYLKSS